MLGDFSFYDYREPLAIDPALHHAFRVVVIDPPYLVRLFILLLLTEFLDDELV